MKHNQNITNTTALAWDTVENQEDNITDMGKVIISHMNQPCAAGASS